MGQPFMYTFNYALDQGELNIKLTTSCRDTKERNVLSESEKIGRQYVIPKKHIIEFLSK